MQRRGARILGPYQEPDGIRYVILDGQGGRSSIKAPSEQEAQTLAEATLRKINGQEVLTVDAAIKQYENHLRDVKGNKPRPIATTAIRLRSFFTATAKDKKRAAADLEQSLVSLTAKRCETLYVSLSGRPCSACKVASPLGAASCVRCGAPDLGEPRMKPDTHRNMLSEARTFLVWCCEKPRRWLQKNPLEGVKGVGRRRHGKPQLRLDEARRWLDVAFRLADQGDDGAVGALMTLTMGLSGEEITMRVNRDVDDVGRLLHITDGKTAARRKPFPVPEEMRGYLYERSKGKDPGAPLFPGKRQRPHWRDWPAEQVRRICGLAGVPVVSGHGMRGLRGTLEVQGGRSLRDAADVLRHVDESTTERSYVDPEVLEQARQVRIMRTLGLDRSRTIPGSDLN